VHLRAPRRGAASVRARARRRSGATTARLGGRGRRPAEPRGAAAPRVVAGGGRAMAWWRARVVAPARRAWLAVVAGRLRRGRTKGHRAGKCRLQSAHRGKKPRPISSLCVLRRSLPLRAFLDRSSDLGDEQEEEEEQKPLRCRHSFYA
jgi:hypothetical protein